MSLAPAGFCRDFESDVQQKQDDQDQCCGNLNISANIPEIHFSISLSSNTVKSKNIVPNKIFIVKAKNSFGVCGKSIFTPMKPPANQAAEILIDRAESALSQYRGIFFTKASLTGGQIGVNQSLGRSKTLSLSKGSGGMSDERDRGLEPDDVFEELEVILGGDEKDKLFEVFLSLRSAIAMGVYLDAPRSWVLLQKTKPKKSVEEEARIQELFRCLLGDPVINQVEDPNVLLDSTIKPDTILGKPEEEGILWMLADKFPTVREVIDCMGELRDRLNEPYKVNISYRELDALGHSVLREIYRGEEYTSNPSSDEPSFIHEAYQNIRSNDAKLNRSLIKAFFELKHSFVDSGGIDPKEISEALEKKLNNLSTDS